LREGRAVLPRLHVVLLAPAVEVGEAHHTVTLLRTF
jgi:hypothetical protein